VTAQAPIQFDRASGTLEGANLWERTAALALSTGSKISQHFSHRGYNHCANLLRRTLPARNIAVRLNEDAVFEFPYGDGYWSKLLNRGYHYEDELELLFRGAVDVDYTLIDCGANYGYWSVLVSSRPFGSHKVIAIEPSSQNFSKLANNALVNGDRFDVIARWDGLRRQGNVLRTSDLLSDSALLRYTVGGSMRLYKTTRLKMSGELYDFSDFPDRYVIHTAVTGAF